MKTKARSKSRHVRRDALQCLLRDVARTAAAKGRLDDKTSFSRPALALGAAIIGQPHKTAMGVLDAGTDAMVSVTARGGRKIMQVAGSSGEQYYTYSGFCSCKFSEKHAEKSSFFRCKHMVAAELALAGAGSEPKNQCALCHAFRCVCSVLTCFCPD